MDFIASPGQFSAQGFQLSVVSVPDDLRQVIDAVKGTGVGREGDKHSEQVQGNNLQEQQLVKHLMKLLSPSVRNKELRRIKKDPQTNPFIEVVEDPGNDNS